MKLTYERPTLRAIGTFAARTGYGAVGARDRLGWGFGGW